MPTTRPAADRPNTRTDVDVRPALLAGAYVLLLAGSLAGATLAAVLAASVVEGLAGIVVVAGAWLGAVAAAPALARRGTVRLAEVEFAERAPRSTRAVATALRSRLVR